MEIKEKKFKHVSNSWDEEKAKELEGDEVGLLIYRSNQLGGDLRITNYGGGNTSCKTFEKDPLTGREVEVMWVKGSGGDIGTLTRAGLAGLYQEKLLSLENVYRGLEHEDEMVKLYNHCFYDLDSRAPSIDTALHAFLPFRHIDHLHPDAIIAIAASKDGEKITRELFNGSIAWVPWQRPGFDLGLRLRDAYEANPNIRGIMLGGHGIFTWGDTSLECYMNSLEVIEEASQYIEDNLGKKGPVFGGSRIKSLPGKKRHQQAAAIAPVLRGLCSSHDKMIGTYTDDEVVMEFINSEDLSKLAPMGTSCPDHFLRTKIAPLVLNLEPNADLSDAGNLRARLSDQFEKYRSNYATYYEKHKHPDSPPMRDPNPVIILWPGVGMFAFAKNKQTSRVASEFYVNAINVMRGAEAISTYVSLPAQEAFNIEYWLLEEAKLQRLPKEKPLSRHIALITGSAGGIGKAIARKYIQEGACVILSDNDEERLNCTIGEFEQEFGQDAFIGLILDVTNEGNYQDSFEKAVLKFGGLDIAVNNAGISISKPFSEHDDHVWSKMIDIMLMGQFNVSKHAVNILTKQGLGGDIINIVSKNALVSGPKNVAYGTVKAAQLHMSRLMASELGEYKIRVNVINPDAVIENSKIWESGWAEDRAKAYGVPLDELPSFYAGRTILKEKVTVEDIAEAAFVFVGGSLKKSTGNMLNVDGGLPAAFPR